MTTVNEVDPEISAIGFVFNALRGLDSASQARVLDYVALKLGVRSISPAQTTAESQKSTPEPAQLEVTVPEDAAHPTERDDDDESLEGISSVAKKWMRRSSLSPTALSKLFSLGIDDIDLVAKAVPGESKKERMHSIFLLEGIAAYLGTGVARFTHEKVKEACLHYDAFDNANFAKHYRDFSTEVSGSKDSGYTLTARGISAATDLIQQMASQK